MWNEGEKSVNILKETWPVYISVAQGRVILEDGISTEKMPHKTGLWAGLCCIFLIDVGETSLLWVDGPGFY